MVGVREVDMLYLEEMYRASPEKFIQFLNDMDETINVSFNEGRAKTYLAKLLHQNGYGVEEISAALNMAPKDLRARLSRNVATSTVNAFRILDVATVMRMTQEFPFSITISKLKVKRLLAMDLLKAGWCAKCVAAVTGLSIRTIQRYKRKLDE